MPSAGRFRYLEGLRQSSTRDRGVLVLIHAFPVNARMWERQLALAERGWRVIAPQLRGFGGARNLRSGDAPFGTLHTLEVNSDAEAKTVRLTVDG